MSTPDSNLQRIIDRQVSLAVEAIWAGVHAGPDPESVSFRHILNRIMILVQYPITFILFCEQQNGSVVRQYTFNKHPRHFQRINDKGDTATKDQMFQLFGTRYYLLVLNATSPYNFDIIPCSAAELPRKPKVEHIVQYKIGRITKLVSFEFYANFNSLVTHSLEACRDWPTPPTETQPPRLLEDSIDQIGFLKALRSNTTQYNLDGYGVIDRIYRKTKKSIESISKGNGLHGGARLTNFVLFARDYAVPANYVRHGSYNYRLRMIICSTQRSDLKEFFQTHTRGNFTALLKAVRKERQLYKKEVKGKFYKSIAQAAASKFFRMLIQDDGDEKLLKILESPVGIDARSMADPVFDGVTFFRDPFTKGGFSRCFPEGAHKEDDSEGEGEGEGAKFDDLTEECQQDVLRVIICRYLFDAMAADTSRAAEQLSGSRDIARSPAPTRNPDSPIDRLQIMLNPIELGGRVWCVTGHLTRSIDPKRELVDRDTINTLASYWLQNYHIYQTINERARKNLRVYMSQLYEATVGNIYQEETLKFLGHTTKRAVVEAAVNERLARLACLFPYDVVQIELEPKGAGSAWPEGPADSADRSSRRAVLTDEIVSVVSKESNLVFPSAPSLAPDVPAKFVSTTDIAVAMSDAILRGSIAAYMRLKSPINRGRGSDATP